MKVITMPTKKKKRREPRKVRQARNDVLPGYPVTVRMSPILIRALDEQAESEGVTRSFLIVERLTEAALEEGMLSREDLESVDVLA